MNYNHSSNSSSPKEELRQQVMQGAIERYGNEFVQTPVFIQRLETELQALCAKENTVNYLLMILDTVNAAREMGICVGPGRSSAAGSLVLYCLKITDVDPLKYGLLFERFYSDSRFLPTIDIDFECNEHEKVVDYVTRTYGEIHPGRSQILGLCVLTMIKLSLRNIKHSRGIDLSIHSIPLNDEQTFRLFRVEQIPQFIANKHRKDEIGKNLPVMKECLKETYGRIVYQEQTMLLVQQIASFTPAESDKLRRALGRMDQPIVDEMKTRFLSSGTQNGHDEKDLERVWQTICDSRSTFLKAHSVCYTWLAYQVAYLKAHYLEEFLDARTTTSHMH